MLEILEKRNHSTKPSTSVLYMYLEDSKKCSSSKDGWLSVAISVGAMSKTKEVDTK